MSMFLRMGTRLRTIRQVAEELACAITHPVGEPCVRDHAPWQRLPTIRVEPPCAHKIRRTGQRDCTEPQFSTEL